MTTEQTVFVYNDSDAEVKLKIERPVCETWFFEPLIQNTPSLPLYSNRKTKFKLYSGKTHIASIWLNPSGDVVAIRNHSHDVCAISFEFLFNYPSIIIIDTPHVGHLKKYDRLENGMINATGVQSIDLGTLLAKKK